MPIPWPISTIEVEGTFRSVDTALYQYLEARRRNSFDFSFQREERGPLVAYTLTFENVGTFGEFRLLEYTSNVCNIQIRLIGGAEDTRTTNLRNFTEGLFQTLQRRFTDPGPRTTRASLLYDEQIAACREWLESNKTQQQVADKWDINKRTLRRYLDDHYPDRNK